MSVINSLKQKLRPLGFYNLNENSLISAELSAYALVLDEIESQLLEIEKEKFIVTAQDYGLKMRERVLGPEQNEKTVQDRRNLLLYRYSTSYTDFNKTAIEKFLSIVGVTGSIIEAPSQNKIYINCLNIDPSLDKNQIKSAISEFLPAHLDCIFDFRNLTWKYIDAKNNSFDTLDSLNFTWDQIDNLNEI